MLDAFLREAAAGRPVMITDVRAAFAGSRTPVHALLTLPDGERVKRFTVELPPVGGLTEQERGFVRTFVRAELYNHLATLGGVRLDLYFDRSEAALGALVNDVIDEFGLKLARADRTAYGRIVNVLDRMIAALHGADRPGFTIETHDAASLAPRAGSVEFRADPTPAYRMVSEGLEGRIVCGLDVGGTDIKAALAVDGRLAALKEYDWNPAAYPDVERIIDPIVTIVRLLRARAALELPGADRGDLPALRASVEAGLAHRATVEEMSRISGEVESALGGVVRGFDAIGLCFPDVVVRNRIVGGEVPKTQGMRRNRLRDFETQFAQLTALDRTLAAYCAPGGVVGDTNDGPMAAFTAAVELASSPHPEVGAGGVFAHTLGTDLGTGIALADGSIPEIPLEAYNLIVDLGSDAARSLPAADLRSSANTNTGIPGTLQRLTSQAAAFRFTDEVASFDEALRAEVRSLGFVETRNDGGRDLLVVPEEPVDQRKPYLAYLMERAASDEAIADVFRRIGEYMAVVYLETEHILRTGIRERFLFGRFVKAPHCFALLEEGARRRSEELRFVAADSEMAYTPLMRQLADRRDYTVAQFGQAVGAIYFGNLPLAARSAAEG